MDKKKVLIAIIVIGLLLSGFTLIAGAYFVGSSESDVFHKPSCFYVDRIKPDHLIRFDTVREACEAGYRPCKDCGPPTCPPSPSEVTTNAATGITTVDDDGGADFIRIQDAINKTKDGDTIIVHPGVYYENVVVNKSVTLKGIDHPAVDAEGKGNAITLTADGITLEGFNITNAGSPFQSGYDGIITIYTYSSGIFLDRSRNNKITNNKVSNNGDNGIYLFDSSNNTITGNTLSNNGDNGIHLHYCRNNNITGNTFVNDGLFVSSCSRRNTVEDNTVNGKLLVYLEDASDFRVKDAGQVILVNCTNITVEKLVLSNTSVGVELLNTENCKIINNNISKNNVAGIYLRYSGNNTITGNNVSNNNAYGIYLRYSSNNNIIGNTVGINNDGIHLWSYCSNNLIRGNNVSNNNDDGIYLSYFYSYNNTIIGNEVSNNNAGIRLYDSSSNIITGNNVSNNNRYGIFFSSSSNNHIYLNNFINNSNIFSHSTNICNSEEKITYTYNGSTYESYLGNYWSDYEEKYPDAEEIDSTGIWNTPYWIEGDKDNYPLIVRFVNYITSTSAPASPSLEIEYGVKYKVMVVDVIDGDTIDVTMPNGSEERVRMLGVDTPETTSSGNKLYEYDDITDLQCLESWGLKAKQFTTSNLEGQEVYIEFDSLAGLRGYYGRLLTYVYYENETDFTADLVKQGYARVYTEGDCEKELEYLTYQNYAMGNNIGLWTCRAETPPPTAKFVISAHYDAAGNDHENLNDEYIILKNIGGTSINLKGWVMRDEANHKYVFPTFELQPSAQVTIRTGSGTNTPTDLYWRSGRAIWNNKGDTVYLYDAAGNLVAKKSW